MFLNENVYSELNTFLQPNSCSKRLRDEIGHTLRKDNCCNSTLAIYIKLFAYGCYLSSFFFIFFLLFIYTVLQFDLPHLRPHRMGRPKA